MLVLLVALLFHPSDATINPVLSGNCSRCFWERKYPVFPPYWARSASRNEPTLLAGAAMLYPIYYKTVVSADVNMWATNLPTDGYRYTSQASSTKPGQLMRVVIDHGGCETPAAQCVSPTVTGITAQIPQTIQSNGRFPGWPSPFNGPGSRISDVLPLSRDRYFEISRDASGREYLAGPSQLYTQRTICVAGLYSQTWRAVKVDDSGQCDSLTSQSRSVPDDEYIDARKYHHIRTWTRVGDQRPTLDSRTRPNCPCTLSCDVRFRACSTTAERTVLGPTYYGYNFQIQGGTRTRDGKTYRYNLFAHTSNITLWCGPRPGFNTANGPLYLYTPEDGAPRRCENGVMSALYNVCVCNDGWGGLYCHQAIPSGFDPANATACPNSTVYDMCYGRGVCEVEPSGVGLYCRCKHGWFPGRWGVNATEEYVWSWGDLHLSNFMRDYEDTVNLYASVYSRDCGERMLPQWSDDTGWVDRYPRYHLCAFWDGPLNHNYERSSSETDKSRRVFVQPIYPYNCADDRAQGGYLYGGWWCKPCTARCSVEGTANCSDVDALAAKLAPTENSTGTEVACFCKRGWTGADCSVRQCPVDPVAFAAHHNASECSSDKGRGTCVPEASNTAIYGAAILSDGSYRSAWNSSFAGRCVCNEGFSGLDNTCSKQICPVHSGTGAVCGAHGSCVPSNCTTETKTVNNLTAVNEALELCERDCLTSEDTNGCGTKQLSLTDMYDAIYAGLDRGLSAAMVNEIRAYLYLPPKVVTATPSYLEYTYTDGAPSGDLPLTYYYFTAVLYTEFNSLDSQAWVALTKTYGDITLAAHKHVLDDLTNVTALANRVLCAIAHRECQIDPLRGGLTVVDNTPTSTAQVTFTSTSACGEGTCVCETGWGINPQTGTCDWRLCDNGDNGLECSGLTIGSFYNGAGANVCNRDPTNPTCECWMALDANPGDSSNQINGRYGPTCSSNYSTACNGASGLYCSNAGTCRVDGCGTTWTECSPSADRNAAPVCTCKRGTSGAQCQDSDCGGDSSIAPCSAVNNVTLLRFNTGVCDLRDQECKCKQVDGVMYVGTNCETAAPECSAGDNKLCSGHGECLFVGSSYLCECDSGYSGAKCENSIPCGGTCNETNGVCVGGTTCSCHEFFTGSDCSQNLCVETGGENVGIDHCDCDAGNGTIYPGPHDPSPSSFKGCRKLCPLSTIIGEQEECGGLKQTTLGGTTTSRCSSQVALTDTVSPDPTCDCSLNGPNPNVGGELQEWISDGLGACKPKCLHCKQSSGTGDCLPDECVSPPCQYTGVNCDQPRCDNGGYWTGSECTCRIDWLHTAVSNCSEATDICAAQGLGNFSMAPHGEQNGAHHCICTFPYVPDTDPSSATYRLCISACGAYGTPNTVTETCDCTASVEGTYCNQSVCADGGVPSGDGSTCACNNEYPQWGGTHCNTSLCQSGGTPLPVPQEGCSCPVGWIGTLCETMTHPVPNSNGVHNESSNTYDCKPGWSGTHCNISACGVGLPIKPVPCGESGQPTCVFSSHNYNCYCSQGGLSSNFYEPSGACLPLLTSAACSEHGKLGAGGSNGETLVCGCDHPWITGTTCNQDPCGNGGSGPLSHQKIALVDGTYVCQCHHEPFRYDLSNDCQSRNCSAMAWPEAASQGYGDVIQVDTETCGCAVAGHVLRYDHPSWADTSDTANGDRVWCGPDCAPVTTAEEDPTGCLRCIENFTGTDCRTTLYDLSSDSSPALSKVAIYAIIGSVVVLIGLGIFAGPSLVKMIQGGETETVRPDRYPRYGSRVPDDGL